jgi:hypothetical protein
LTVGSGKSKTRDMPTIAHVHCNQCDTHTIVFPPALLTALPEAARPGLTEALATLKDDNGQRFALANATGHYPCPGCGANGYAPQIDLN